MSRRQRLPGRARRGLWRYALQILTFSGGALSPGINQRLRPRWTRLQSTTVEQRHIRQLKPSVATGSPGLTMDPERNRMPSGRASTGSSWIADWSTGRSSMMPILTDRPAAYCFDLKRVCPSIGWSLMILAAQAWRPPIRAGAVGFPTVSVQSRQPSNPQNGCNSNCGRSMPPPAPSRAIAWRSRSEGAGGRLLAYRRPVEQAVDGLVYRTPVSVPIKRTGHSC